MSVCVTGISLIRPSNSICGLISTALCVHENEELRLNAPNRLFSASVRRSLSWSLWLPEPLPLPVVVQLLVVPVEVELWLAACCERVLRSREVVWM